MEDRLEEIKKIVEQMPNDPFPRYGLAMEYKTSGNLQAADETFRDLAQRHPAYVPQYLMHGQVLVSLQRPDEARAVRSIRHPPRPSRHTNGSRQAWWSQSDVSLVS